MKRKADIEIVYPSSCKKQKVRESFFAQTFHIQDICQSILPFLSYREMANMCSVQTLCPNIHSNITDLVLRTREEICAFLNSSTPFPLLQSLSCSCSTDLCQPFVLRAQHTPALEHVHLAIESSVKLYVQKEITLVTLVADTLLANLVLSDASKLRALSIMSADSASVFQPTLQIASGLTSLNLRNIHYPQLRQILQHVVSKSISSLHLEMDWCVELEDEDEDEKTEIVFPSDLACIPTVTHLSLVSFATPTVILPNTLAGHVQDLSLLGESFQFQTGRIPWKIETLSLERPRSQDTKLDSIGNLQDLSAVKQLLYTLRGFVDASPKNLTTLDVIVPQIPHLERITLQYTRIKYGVLLEYCSPEHRTQETFRIHTPLYIRDIRIICSQYSPLHIVLASHAPYLESLSVEHTIADFIPRVSAFCSWDMSKAFISEVSCVSSLPNLQRLHLHSCIGQPFVCLSEEYIPAMVLHQSQKNMRNEQVHIQPYLVSECLSFLGLPFAKEIKEDLMLVHEQIQSFIKNYECVLKTYTNYAHERTKFLSFLEQVFAAVEDLNVSTPQLTTSEQLARAYTTLCEHHEQYLGDFFVCDDLPEESFRNRLHQILCTHHDLQRTFPSVSLFTNTSSSSEQMRRLSLLIHQYTNALYQTKLGCSELKGALRMFLSRLHDIEDATERFTQFNIMYGTMFSSMQNTSHSTSL